MMLLYVLTCSDSDGDMIIVAITQDADISVEWETKSDEHGVTKVWLNSLTTDAVICSHRGDLQESLAKAILI